MLDSTLKIAFIGGGSMSQALVSGLIKQGLRRDNIMVCTPSASTRLSVNSEHHVRVTRHNKLAVGFADVIIVAVDSQQLLEISLELNDEMEALQQQKLIISVAAGLKHHDLKNLFNNSNRVVTAYPNLPSAICEGLTGLYASNDCDLQDTATAEQIMAALGQTIWIDDEKKVPALIATAGSSPAYFFLFMEAMEKAAIEQGLEPEIAKTSVLQSALGAVNMAARSTESLNELKQQVTPASGSTASALASFQQEQLEQIVARAMWSAASTVEDLYSLNSAKIH